MRCVCFRCISNYVYANETTTTRSQQQSFIFWDDDNNDAAAAVILISRKRTGNMKNSKKINFNWTMNVLCFFFILYFFFHSLIFVFSLLPPSACCTFSRFFISKKKYSKFLSIFLESFSGILPVCRWWIYEIMLPILRLFSFFATAMSEF